MERSLKVGAGRAFRKANGRPTMAGGVVTSKACVSSARAVRTLEPAMLAPAVAIVESAQAVRGAAVDGACIRVRVRAGEGRAESANVRRPTRLSITRGQQT